MEINKEMLKGYLESIILSLLQKEDLYGYEILKRIKEKSNDTFSIKEGTLYIILKRLEVNNLISSYWSNSISGGGRRRYHKITEEGLSYLKEKKSEWLFFKGILNNFFKEV